MSDRYVVIEGSESGHCCFQYSVMDARHLDREPICETYTLETATQIAEALNQGEKPDE